MRDMKTQEIYTAHCRIIGMPSRDKLSVHDPDTTSEKEEQGKFGRAGGRWEHSGTSVAGACHTPLL